MNEILLCAVGTGMNDREIPYEDAKDWGPLGWAKPVISVMMDGMSDLADYHARQLLPHSDDDPSDSYDITTHDCPSDEAQALPIRLRPPHLTSQRTAFAKACVSCRHVRSRKVNPPVA